MAREGWFGMLEKNSLQHFGSCAPKLAPPISFIAAQELNRSRSANQRCTAKCPGKRSLERGMD